MTSLQLNHSYSDSAPRAGACTQEAATFPALREMISLVDAAMSRGSVAAVLAHLSARLPDLLQKHQTYWPAALLQPAREHYRRYELHHCPIHGYQIVAIVWGPGQGTPIHDHQDQWGIDAVVQGELQIAQFSIHAMAGTAMQLRAGAVRELRRGDIETVDASHGLHLCRNPSRRSAALSVHIYGRAIDTLGIYEAQGDGWHLRSEQPLLVESLSTP